MTEDINFDCPFCTQNLDAPPDMCGMEIECPTCENLIVVPHESTGAGGNCGDASMDLGAEPGGDDDVKGTTVRIDLPKDIDIPAAAQNRIVTIKRKGGDKTTFSSRRSMRSQRKKKTKKSFWSWLFPWLRN